MRKIFLIHLGVFLCVCMNSFSQSVTVTGSLNNARWFHESQLLYNGKVLAFGGDNCNFLSEVVFSTSELYNPVTKTWSFTGSMNNARTKFASVILNSGNVMAIGGSDQNDNSLASAEIYNVQTGVWQLTASMQLTRSSCTAVKLQDGRVLTVGGYTNKTELYDPETNTWAYTGDMSLNHGYGVGMVLLDDGQVLATGGDNALTKAELYNPATGQWTLLAASMSRNHYYHKFVRMPNGNFLLAGTQTFNTSDQISTEIYNPTTKTFSNTANLLNNIGVSPLILLDDGKILAYGIGDFFNASNVKSLQLYNTATSTWTAIPYNLLGNNIATGHKLQDGSVILIGGSFTTGNGASVGCLLINQTAYAGCTPPNLTLSVNGNTVCNGFASSVSIPTSESGVSYQASIAGKLIGAPVTGGSAINIPVSETLLLPGKNIVNIVATKTGCQALHIVDTAIITVASSGITRPEITPSGSTSICSGSNVDLSAPAGMSTYEWSTGASTQTITVSAAGSFRVRVRNGGCYSSWSNPLQVIITPSTVIAGVSQTVCANVAAFPLTGFSPAGGTWSGTGVSPTGTFNPATSGTGSFTLTYSLCGNSSNKTITINAIPKVNPYTLTAFYDSVCLNASTSITLANPTSGAIYTFYKNATLQTTITGGTTSFFINTGAITTATEYTVNAVLYSGCGNDTLIKKIKINLLADPYLGVGTKTPTICRGQSAQIFIVKSTPSVSYQLMIGSTTLGVSKKGNGDTLFINTGNLLPFGPNLISVDATEKTCTKTLFQKATITVTGPESYFTIPNYNPEVGENVSLLNSSVNAGGTYEWTFGANASSPSSSIQNPADITYSAAGKSTLKLICTDAQGCKDSLVRIVNVIDPVATTGCNYSVAISEFYQFKTIATAYDKEDNSFLFTSDGIAQMTQYSNLGDSLKDTYADIYGFNKVHTLTKYNTKGLLQWTTTLRHNSTWAKLGDMITDSLGNVYCSYYHGEYLDNIRIYSTNGTSVTFDPPHNASNSYSVILVKFDKNGILQWYQTYLEYYTITKLALALDKNLNLYATSDKNLNKFDKNGALLWGKTVGYMDIEINSQDQVMALKAQGLIVDKYSNTGTLLSSTPAIVTQGTTYINSRYLKLDNKDNLYIMGSFSGTLTFKGVQQADIYTGGAVHSDLFICKITPTGGQEWFKRIKTNSQLWINGFDLKDNNIIMLGGGSTNTSMNYNQSGSSYLDTLKLTATTNYIITSDTADGQIRIQKINEGNIGGTGYPNHNLAFSKVSNKIIFAFNIISGFAIDQFIVPKTISANQSSCAVMRYSIECMFPPLTPISQFGTTGPKCSGTAVQFTDLSKNKAETWSWTFPGGTPSTSNIKNPLVTFSSSGNYSATLYTTNTIGTGTTYTGNVTIGDAPIINVSPNQVCSGSNITLTASGAATYVWENAATGSSTLFYNITKDTIITVTGTSSLGCTTAFDHTVTKKPLPVLSIQPGYPTQVCLTTNNIDVPIASPTSGTFTGTGVSGNKFYPSTAGIGTHSIIYTYTDGNSCSNTISTSIQVYKPTITFQAGFPSQVCYTTSDIDVPIVNPTGGTFAGVGVSGTKFYPGTAGIGYQTITYSYTDGNGCSNTANKYIDVYLPVITVYMALPSNVCSNAPVVTLPYITPTGGTFSGNGVTGNQFNPSTAALGSNTILYDYTDPYGCSNNKTMQISVSTCTGTEKELSENALSVFPNPSNGKIFIESSYQGKETYNLSVISSDGKIVVNDSPILLVGKNEIDLSSFGKGLYTIRIQSSSGNLVHKTIMIH